jgi:6-phosphofructokinase 1
MEETSNPGHERIAFLTSGGDSPGMNSAIRAIVRMSLYRKATPYAIFEGYKGLVYDNIAPFNWNDVSNLLSSGGTYIKTSRCAEFLDREYRKRGAFNLIKRGICKLIVVGGDGSLSGADRLREEWPDFVQELLEEKAISEETCEKCKFLSIVGLVGSIDNDMCGTEITIGANSSLHRIVEAVDSISSTASSHSRAFVIEVMGRNCGWLALNAWIATGADWLFCPEDPPVEGWEDIMCSSLKLVIYFILLSNCYYFL